ncbi:thioesterase family protein [Roseibium sp.]|uniref:acyl-CoA thioesterase n=1 Tax=Roseibium sp. TaxID=1936156 RepID=UPI002628C333|nr:thioesterase family protein [Roseibium sp.]
MIEEAAPRGIQTGPGGLRATLPGLLAKEAGICFRGTVLPRDIGVDGKADDQYALACCTDGVAHVWERTPMTRAFLGENGFGRVAVEMKLTWATPLKTGDAVVVATGFTGVGSKSFNMRHHLFESRTKRLAATLDVVALMMDLTSRTSVQLPEDTQNCISKMLID